MTVALMNTTIITADGDYTLRSITLDEARAMVAKGYQSFIGHESTAQVMTELLGVPVEANRQGWFPEPGDSAICFKLNSRPKEGAILTRAELESIGFSFKLLTRLTPEPRWADTQPM